MSKKKSNMAEITQDPALAVEVSPPADHKPASMQQSPDGDDPHPTLDAIKKMSRLELEAFCQSRGLSLIGDLVDTAVLAIHGVSDRYVGRLTRCRACTAGVRVTGSQQSDMGDGRVMIVRSVQCKGPDQHTYSMKEIVGEAPTLAR